MQDKKIPQKMSRYASRTCIIFLFIYSPWKVFLIYIWNTKHSSRLIQTNVPLELVKPAFAIILPNETQTATKISGN